MRYLGIIRSLSLSKGVRKMLLIEMLARTGKNLLRQQLRDTIKQEGGQKGRFKHHKVLVCDFVNRFIGHGEDSKLFWKQELLPKMTLCFPPECPKELGKPASPEPDPELDFEIEEMLEMGDVRNLLEKFQRLSGVTISADVLKEIENLATEEIAKYDRIASANEAANEAQAQADGGFAGNSP